MKTLPVIVVRMVRFGSYDGDVGSVYNSTALWEVPSCMESFYNIPKRLSTWTFYVLRLKGYIYCINHIMKYDTSCSSCYSKKMAKEF